ncbi:hypothetical protein BD410DRAFT_609593 [Rickenella mellea]|uniref:RNI-like protein n=1 Tax=Rickenella mellea TaxID=50990 RepID=A0A4Y7QEZ0_9AGAM|nr:hypothetical protein BD410DRAFT_609593 [Rickenella mellea]
MAVSSTPVVDQANPFYCPALSAAEFLSNVRARNDITQFTQLSFYTRLSLSLQDFDIGHGRVSSNLHYASHDVFSHSQHNPSFSTVPSPREGILTLKRNLDAISQSDSSMPFSRPPKRERSNLDIQESSFVLSSKAERLRFPSSLDSDSSAGPHYRQLVAASRFHDDIGLQPKIEESDAMEFHAPGEFRHHPDGCQSQRQLEDELYGPDIGDERLGFSSLFQYLACVVPEDVFDECLLVQKRSHQEILDELILQGVMNADILDVFRRANIVHLNLSESGHQSNKSMVARETLQIFMKPNSFNYLKSLTLSGIWLEDYDMTKLHHLPIVERLYLRDTHIGNEGIMHLVALKRSLRCLDVSENDRIDDDSTPSLVVLHRLDYLCMQATSITMHGVRKLGYAASRESRNLTVDVPTSCQKYLKELHLHYKVNLNPPLIVDPSVSSELSATALRRNLVAHAAHNPSISSSGSREEMAERLTILLDRREKDLMARNLIVFDQHVLE